MFWHFWHVPSCEFQNTGRFHLYNTIHNRRKVVYKPRWVDVQLVVWIWEKEILVVKFLRVYLQLECRTFGEFKLVVAWHHWWRRLGTPLLPSMLTIIQSRFLTSIAFFLNNSYLIYTSIHCFFNSIYFLLFSFRLFLHIFCHSAFHFSPSKAVDW